MSEENIYASPESDPETLDSADSPNTLASRLSRLGASLLDTLILLVILVPIMFLTGYLTDITAEAEPSYLEQLAYSLVGIVIFMLLNLQFLLSNGQTIGKKIVGIKIVGPGGSKLDMGIIAKRYGVYFLAGQIPVVGRIFSLVNVLFIFGKEQRCIHDIVADTDVIVCK